MYYFFRVIGRLIFLEQINRKCLKPIVFRVNVFKEDIISRQKQLVRNNYFNDGKAVNVLLVEYEHLGRDYSHYVLIYKHSFLRKRYVNPESGKISFANNIFCTTCFAHFTSKNSLETHSKLCNTNIHQIKVFPNEIEVLSFKDYQFNYKRIFTGYCDFESILNKTGNEKSVTCVKKRKAFPVSSSIVHIVTL